MDLIAREAEYHKSCRVQFDKQTACEKAANKSQSTYFLHKNAFESLCEFIQNSVIFNMRPVLMSSLHEMYVAEYVGLGGDKDDITSYSRQDLQKKLNEKYGEKLRAVLFDQRKGNSIYALSSQRKMFELDLMIT